MLYRHKNKNMGYSLLELSIYMAILVAILTLTADLIFNISKSRGRMEETSEIQQNLRYAQERITLIVQKAIAVNLASGSDLSLALPQPTENPTDLRLNNGIIQLSVGGNPFENLTNEQVNVSFLEFNQIGATVQIKITAEFRNKIQETQFSAALKGVP